MFGTTKKITARITPVPPAAREAVRTRLGDGDRVRAVARLRKDADLGLREAVAAVDLLAEGIGLPGSYEEAVGVLESLEPDLYRELRALVEGGDHVPAVRLLRQRTGIGLIKGNHLVHAIGPDRSTS
ncbi:hypothetical protein [Streptomyces sp. NPDC058953]|uniref:hypothetical protein n=1 Tax=unclassified Streptomyces TaxID=2593676 RepID=UPI0036A89AA3